MKSKRNTDSELESIAPRIWIV